MKTRKRVREKSSSSREADDKSTSVALGETMTRLTADLSRGNLHCLIEKSSTSRRFDCERQVNFQSTVALSTHQTSLTREKCFRCPTRAEKKRRDENIDNSGEQIGFDFKQRRTALEN
jgi:hypothetical protein